MNNDEPNVDLGDPDVDREAANQNQRQLDGPTDFDSADHARDARVTDNRPDTHIEHDDGSIADSMAGDPANPYPTGDDPFVSPNSPDDVPVVADEVEAEVAEIQREDPVGEDGPTYERNQGPADRNDGGTTDSHNTMTSSDTGLREDL